MYAVKEHNAGKLDSHFWFCCAFADVLDPTYTFMVRDEYRKDVNSTIMFMLAVWLYSEARNCSRALASFNCAKQGWRRGEGGALLL
jgi:hypothetical protein